jgi:hypothetical protein
MEALNKKYNFLIPIKIENIKRLGRNGDGGYICENNTVKSSEILVTFGMCPDWSFELDYIKENPKVKIFIYDYTVSAAPYVKEVWKYFRRYITFRDKTNALKQRINYLKDYLSFFKIKNINFYSEKITYPTKKKIDTDIKKVFERIDSDNSTKGKNIFLKCDIEGSEYNIINGIFDYSKRINALIFEFHWLDKNEEIFLESIKKLQKYFDIFHIHGNNHCEKLVTGLPIVLEISMINKKYILEKKEFIKSFPIKDLDSPNNPNREDLSFYFDI